MMSRRAKRRGTKNRTPDGPESPLPPEISGPLGPLEPSDRLLKLSEVLQLARHGKSWLYGNIKAGLFPPGYRIGRNRFWLLSEVMVVINRLLRP
jgi:prophage regulatory protein